MPLYPRLIWVYKMWACIWISHSKVT